MTNHRRSFSKRGEIYYIQKAGVDMQLAKHAEFPPKLSTLETWYRNINFLKLEN